ncbi:MAG: hypothetical protein CMJ81_14055 [Planctomycetaceae bacterium]|nr:hypothetical protein [Planctomycetaceae bacterium]
MSHRWLIFGLTILLVVISFYAARSLVVPRHDGTESSGTGAEDLPNPLRVSDPLVPFFCLLSADRQSVNLALDRIEVNWEPSQAAMLVEMLPAVGDREIRQRVVTFLEARTDKKFGRDTNKWFQFVWNANFGQHPNYLEFKAEFYSVFDSSFREYFAEEPPSTIRLNEIFWGGVRRDGIPPLKEPQTVSASQATYLEDSNVVFGIEINGDARAYPQRILAWHEMVKDIVGGESINGVYCTLCGAMIVYRTTVDSVHYELGTSGFLYRSNKLMYDQETKSLWSTLTGRPVVGHLVGKGIELEMLQVVTTTWQAWRERHPHTRVLSLDTGFSRDYGEGVAYKDYFNTDRLMFTVPRVDRRLQNKTPVLALRFPAVSDEQLAVSAEFLEENPVYHDQVGVQKFVILTDKSGAHRVYETGNRRFDSWDGNCDVRDSEGAFWKLSEAELTSPDGEGLQRLPAHSAFWFGWNAAFPSTRLVK